MKRPESPKEQQKALRKARLAKALKANIQRRKAAADEQRKADGNERHE
jgi:hypothetical protein